jgi:hypothetical protein
MTQSARCFSVCDFLVPLSAHLTDCIAVSLKAGGVGLTLTAARRVYLMDPYWNPAVENQAVDRIVSGRGLVTGRIRH